MKLTPEHAAAVFKRLHSTTGYLVRMRERMQQLGFLHTDRLFQQVRDAEFAMRDLCMALHYLSYEGGVATTERVKSRPSRLPPPGRRYRGDGPRARRLRRSRLAAAAVAVPGLIMVLALVAATIVAPPLSVLGQARENGAAEVVWPRPLQVVISIRADRGAGSTTGARMADQPKTRRPRNRRLIILAVAVALVLGIPTGQFGGRVGHDLGGDVGAIVGMVLGFLAVVAITTAVVWFLASRHRPAGPSDE